MMELHPALDSYKRGKNLKDIVVSADLRSNSTEDLRHFHSGQMFKVRCGSRVPPVGWLKSLFEENKATVENS